MELTNTEATISALFFIKFNILKFKISGLTMDYAQSSSAIKLEMANVKIFRLRVNQAVLISPSHHDWYY
ncbi:hypothetical protein U876_05820 [Aeromonas hydrophila NJ-35]|nr:hypothetical protein V428_17420 [Aeromonas hydrophila subsp. hydrophila AL09-71]AHX70563.1 hypothetical protein V429_17455 [Aeromonas hydrophila pc104A]AJE38580.1 hypothetical protein V469_05840 [Aeromonas hydrophila J-1]AKJ36995.1 hypothetical protein U876_05820 [Aeromonas hydrophila NJ-35]ALQ62469.1 hypothetical protein AS145_06055 [Aeromonas hydrophila]